LEINQFVTINAQVPANTVTIFGYTSPNSRVELSSAKAFAVTYSQNNGYFIFDNLNIPRHSLDLCLSSQDESNRLSNPVCLPEPPITNRYTEIGPVLLSPTLTLDLKNQYSSGQSIPNSPIQIYLYQQSSPFSIIKTVHAFAVPILETETDSQGNYSLNLPNTIATNYRIFATTQYFNTNSSKSNTLLYHPNYTVSFLYFLIPLFLVAISLFYLFKKARRHFFPAIYYNKSIILHD
jgi:hypothetical protein